MIEVELPDGNVAEFPDEMPQQRIMEILARDFGGGSLSEVLGDKPQQQARPEPENQTAQVSQQDQDVFEPQEETVPGYTSFMPGVGGIGGNERGVLARATENVPQSARRFAGDIVSAASAPIENIAKPLAKTAAGYAMKLVPGEQEYEAYADALNAYFADRYGSFDNAKKTFETDPVGFLADVSGIFTGAGGIARGAGKAGASVAPRLSGSISKAGSALSAAGRAADPLSMAMTAVKPVGIAGGEAVRGILGGQSLSEKLYGSALKASPAKYNPEKRGEIIRTGIEERIPVSRGGYDKAWKKIENLNSEIDKVLKPAVREGKFVDPLPIAERAYDKTRGKFNTVSPTSDYRAIDSAVNDFLNYHGDKNIPIGEAHELKKNTYARLKDKAYAGEDLKTANVETQKALARGLKEDIAALVPEVDPLNRRESRILKLQEALEPAVGRTENWNPLSLPSAAMAGAGGSVAGGAGATLGFLAGQLSKNPTVLSNAAFALDSMGKPHPVMGATRRASTESAYLAERQKEYLAALLEDMSRRGYPGPRAITEELLRRNR